MVDQQQTELGNSGHADARLAQTFTVGITGLLTEIQIMQTTAVCSSGQLEIQGTTAAGAPNDTALATAPASSIVLRDGMMTFRGYWYTITLPTPLSVTVGTKLAIVRRTDSGTDPTCGWTGGPYQDTYPQGWAYLPDVSGIGWNAVPGWDFTFRTLVQPR